MAEKVRLAVTSSFHNSGLSDHLIPHLETDLEIDIQLIVVGTGQAYKTRKKWRCRRNLSTFKAR